MYESKIEYLAVIKKTRPFYSSSGLYPTSLTKQILKQFYFHEWESQ